MLLELGIYTGVATAASIGPVYKIRRILSKMFRIPFIGWTISLAYGLGISWLLLTLFSFKSSVAGLANLLASIIFSAWLFMESKKA